MIWVQFALLGAAAGFAAGYLGIGGGLIIVPALIAIFSQDPQLQFQAAHLAVATSLASMLVTSLSSIVAHQRRGAIRWDLVGRHTPGLLLGAVLGARLADAMSSQHLTWAFAAFAFIAGLQLLMSRAPEAVRKTPGRLLSTAAGSLMGAISSLVGIGGGSMTAPWFMWHGVRAQEAIASAAACGYPIALAGSLSFLLLSGDHNSAETFGYVHLPALLAISVCSVLFAPLGAAAVHKSPPHRVRQAFGAFLLVMGGILLR